MTTLVLVLLFLAGTSWGCGPSSDPTYRHAHGHSHGQAVRDTQLSHNDPYFDHSQNHGHTHNSDPHQGRDFAHGDSRPGFRDFQRQNHREVQSRPDDPFGDSDQPFLPEEDEIPFIEDTDPLDSEEPLDLIDENPSVENPFTEPEAPIDEIISQPVVEEPLEALAPVDIVPVETVVNPFDAVGDASDIFTPADPFSGGDPFSGLTPTDTFAPPSTDPFGFETLTPPETGLGNFGFEEPSSLDPFGSEATGAFSSLTPSTGDAFQPFNAKLSQTNADQAKAADEAKLAGRCVQDEEGSPGRHGYNLFPERGENGGLRGYGSVPACCSLCARTPGCVAINIDTRHPHRLCFLKAAIPAPSGQPENRRWLSAVMRI